MKIREQIRQYKITIFVLLFILVIIEFIIIVALMIKVSNLDLILDSYRTVTDNTPTTIPIGVSLTVTPSPTPVSVIISSAQRASLVIDNSSSTFCEGLEATAEVPSGTTITSTRSHDDVEGCIEVTLENPEFDLYFYVGDSGAGCFDMVGAVDIGNLSNGKTVYRSESYTDHLGNTTANLVYMYHTIYNSENAECPGSTNMASLKKYSGLFVSCQKNQEICDGIVRSIVINDEMN